MRSLYPEIEANHQYRFKVDPLHEIYVEESGNPDGIPIVFVHGGPGAGSNPNHRRYFNPDRYRIINFDQRGCNRSSPAGEIRNNTTQDLLTDMETIRTRLGVDKWTLFGGSWGATLNLLYAENYPGRVAGMILRGSFLARTRDLAWFAGGGANRLLPEAWDRFSGYIDPQRRHELVSAYYDCVRNNDLELAAAAASHWLAWAGAVVMWPLDMDYRHLNLDTAQAVNEVRVETHYASHAYFIRENQIMDDIRNVPAVPVTIIHGRRDLTCTLDASWGLHQALPQSRLVIVANGGHLASEPVMTSALVQATDDMADLLV